jgi:hypothetical protein
VGSSFGLVFGAMVQVHCILEADSCASDYLQNWDGFEAASSNFQQTLHILRTEGCSDLLNSIVKYSQGEGVL